MLVVLEAEQKTCQAASRQPYEYLLINGTFRPNVLHDYVILLI